MAKWFQTIKKTFPEEAKLLIFDNEDGNSKVFHEFGPKDHEEIDGVLIYENIIIIINGYSGEGRSELDDKHRFFQRLKKMNKIEDFNLVALGDKGKSENENLNLFKKHLEEKKNYEFVLKKVILAPNIKADGSIWDNLENNEFIIDKYSMKYFNYCSEINKEYTLRELLIWLGIRLPEINRLKTDTDIGEPRTGKGYSAIYSKIGEKVNMYTFMAPVKDIIKFIKVLRFESIPRNEKAFQRIVDKERLKRISEKYLNNNESFPNNVILAFHPEVYSNKQRKQGVIRELNTNKSSLIFYPLEEYGSLIVIDGQHRILSHLKNEEDMNKNILISVLDFEDIDKSHEKMSEIFVQINNQHRKISPTVMLKIDAENKPEIPTSRWYLIFRELNKKSIKNYFSERIEFQDTPFKRFEQENENKISINSLIRYSGINQLENGYKDKYKGLLEFFAKDQLSQLLIDYFSIIGDLTKGTLQKPEIELMPRDIGGLLRLMIHFVNDENTKEAFKDLSNPQNKLKIRKYLEKIPFEKLSEIKYGANAWAIMEAHFLANIRKEFPNFGIQDGRLTKNGKEELNRVLEEDITEIQNENASS